MNARGIGASWPCENGSTGKRKKWKRKEEKYRYEHETRGRIYESQAVKPGFVLRGGVMYKGEVKVMV
jgi:hypothetical protein